MTTRKINGKLFKFPDGWHDVPFDVGYQYLKGELKGLELFSALSGVDKKYLKNNDAPEVIQQFLYGFPFLSTPPIETNPEIPISINIGGTNVFFPHVKEDEEFDFGKATVGQIEEMSHVIQKHYKSVSEEEERDLSLIEVMDIMPLVVAMYIQPFVQGCEYDTKKARKLAKVVETECSIREVMNIYQFFFRKFNHLGIGSRNKCQTLRLLTRKCKRAFMKLINFLGSMLR